MNHASEFAGKTSVVKVEVALAMTLGLAAGGGGITYGVYQKNLRKQLQKSHDSEIESLKALITNVVTSKAIAKKAGTK